MKKQTRNILTILALVLIVAVSATSYFMTIGFTTLSLQQSSFRSTDSLLNGPVWILTVRQGGMAQRAEGTFYPSEITADGTHALKSFSIDIVNQKQTCNYPIQIDYNAIPIYSVGYRTYGYDWSHPLGWSYDQIKADCSNYGEVFAIGNFAWSTDDYCYYGTKKTANIGTFNTWNLDFETDISIQVDGEAPITKTITNTADVAFGSQTRFDTIAYAVWQGNLATGDNCPSPADRYVATYQNGAWRIVSGADYDSYKNYFQTTNIPDGSTATVERSVLEQTVSQVNYYGNAAIQEESFYSSGGAKAQTTGTADSGRVYIDLAKQIQFPVFTFYVKADTLGIYQPVGRAQIVSVDSTDFKTGETGNIIAVVKNIGDERGGFEIYAVCPSPFRQVGTNIQTTIEAGQTYTANIPITASVGERTTRDCTVYACVLGNCVSRAVSVTADPQQICTPGQEYCEFDTKIYRCNDAGSGYDLVEDCGEQGKVCSFEAGHFVCKAGVPTPGPDDCVNQCLAASGCTVLDTGCKLKCDLYCAFLGIVWYLVGAIILIVLLVVGFYLVKIFALAKLARR